MRPTERRRREAGWVKPVSAALHPIRRKASLGKTGVGGCRRAECCWLRAGGRRGEPLFPKIWSLARKVRGQRFERVAGLREGVYGTREVESVYGLRRHGPRRGSRAQVEEWGLFHALF